MSERIEALLRDLQAAVREEVATRPENVLTLGEEIAAARARGRLSLQEVGDAAGFTKSHVWEVEKGRATNPTVGMIDGLSRALGVPFLRLAQAALNTRAALSTTDRQPSTRDHNQNLPTGRDGEQ